MKEGSDHRSPSLLLSGRCFAIADQVGDRDDGTAVPVSESLDLRAPGHRAVGVYQLAQYGTGFQPGNPHQLDASFGVPLPPGYAVGMGDEGEEVPGAYQIFGPGGVGKRSAAETPVVVPAAASTETVKLVP